MGPMTIAAAAMAASAMQDKDAAATHRTPPPPAVIIAPPPPTAQMPMRPSGPNLPPTPRNRPALLIDADDYPAAALRENRSGNTTVELAISRWGTIADCRVSVSSGHADLDAATCDRLVTRARFWPATDAAGKDAPGMHTQTVRWALPEPVPPGATSAPAISAVRAPPIPPESMLFPRAPMVRNWGWARIRETDWPTAALEAKREGSTKVAFDLDSAGEVSACRVLLSSGHADLDARSCAIVKERARFDPARGVDGKAAAGRGEQEFDWRVPGEPLPRVAPPARIAPPPRQPAVFPAIFATSGQLTLKMAIGEDGKAVRCETSVKGGSVEVTRALLDTMCREAGERGFRLVPGAAPLPEAAEVTVDVKVTPRRR